MNLDVLIEGLLFYKATPQSKEKMAKLFAASDADLATAITILSARLQTGATRLVETATHLQLATAPELSEFIDTLRKEDLSKDIGKAGAETLALILYKEPISRAEIDQIRGVNSQFILRNLLTRGLVLREPTGNNSHTFRISPNLLQQLGVSSKQELPDFSDFVNKIETFETEKHE